MQSKWLKIFLIITGLLLVSGEVFAQVSLPSVNLGFKSTSNPNEVVSSIKILMILTILTLAPAILIMMTSFTRIIIVLSFVRQALGTQQMPPNQMLVGL
ncbi:MAG: flagellar biosynthetic protein FliP, partial [Bdellovibrionales bacterium]|nr:flagellar biosynthetic protein FliP [Bdellovibrionales bacterium]